MALTAAWIFQAAGKVELIAGVIGTHVPSAVVLINCEIGKEQEIIDHICSLDGAEKAYLVYGVYDVVSVITAATMEGLEAILMQKVRSLPGVKTTMTLMISRDCPPRVRGERV